MKNLKEQYERFFGSLNEEQPFKGRVTPDIARQIAKAMVSRGSKDKMTYDFDLVVAGRFTNGMSKTFQMGDILTALGLNSASDYSDSVYLDGTDIVLGDKTIGKWRGMSKGDFFKLLKKRRLIRF
jgi:hypothetical protein